MAYTTVSGDTWDSVAKTVYGSEEHADLLMEANLRQLPVFRFDAGVMLETPELPAEKDGLAPPWKFEG